jgi:hypothetical protein
MKRISGIILLIIATVLPAFAQNTSIQYSLTTPPMPTRQVPSASNIIAGPGIFNSSPTSGGKAIRLRKKRTRRAITTEPIIIPEPDLKDRPRVE